MSLPYPSGNFTAQLLHIYLRFYFKCNFEKSIFQLQNFGTAQDQNMKDGERSNRYK